MQPHDCKFPIFKRKGVWVCSCGRVYRWQESRRTNRHNQPLRGGGAWLLVNDRRPKA